MTNENPIRFERSGDCVELTVSDPSARSWSGIAPEVTIAEQRALWSVPFLLSGKPTPISRFFTNESGRSDGALITMVVDGETYLGRTTERFGLDLDQYDTRNPLSAGPGPIDPSTLRSTSITDFVEIEPLDLVDAIIEWAERLSDVTSIDSEPVTDIDQWRCSSLLADAISMREHYAKTESLDRFELERSKPDIESLVFEVKSLGKELPYRNAKPRTAEYAIAHGSIADVVLDLLGESSEDVVDRLETATTPDDEVSAAVFEAVAANTDERIIGAAEAALEGEYREKRRQAAKALAGLQRNAKATETLEGYTDDEDPVIRELARASRE